MDVRPQRAKAATQERTLALPGQGGANGSNDENQGTFFLLGETAVGRYHVTKAIGGLSREEADHAVTT